MLIYEYEFQLRESILANYDTRYKRFKREHLCPEDVGLLRNWQWDRNITVAYESVLTDQGWDDLKLLAMREKDRFFEILSGPYDEQRYLVCMRTILNCISSFNKSLIILVQTYKFSEN